MDCNFRFYGGFFTARETSFIEKIQFVFSLVSRDFYNMTMRKKIFEAKKDFFMDCNIIFYGGFFTARETSFIEKIQFVFSLVSRDFYNMRMRKKKYEEKKSRLL